jgi:hypothetical protein
MKDEPRSPKVATINRLRTLPAPEAVQKKRKFKYRGRIAAVLFIITALILTWFFVWRGGNSNSSSAKLTDAQLAERVSKVLLLRPDEKATVSILIEDVDAALKSRPELEGLLKYAATGDYIIQYPERTVVFRPSTDQIVNYIINISPTKK